MSNTFDSLTEREQLLSEYSDVYKDLHGFRPRWMTDETPIEELQSALRRAQVQMDIEIAWEREQKAREEAAQAKEAQASAAALTRTEWTLGDFWSQAVRS